MAAVSEGLRALVLVSSGAATLEASRELHGETDSDGLCLRILGAPMLKDLERFRS